MKKIKREVFLDCDGTFVDLYGVDNWLNFLDKEDTTPYEIAKPLVDLINMTKVVHKLQSNGYKVNIVTWCSKNGSKEYNERVGKAKREWLATYLPDVKFDAIYILPYGTPKSTCGKGYLFDDEEKNRLEWEKHSGKAFNEKGLLKQLLKLI